MEIAGIIFTLMLCVSCCSDPGAKREAAHKTVIKKGVYKDKHGNLYFKVLNPYRFDDPSTGRFRYLKQVYINEEYVPLKKVVDLKTIARKQYEGTYFIDKNYAYIHIDGFLPPGQRRLSAVKTRSAKVFGIDNNYLKTEKTYFYNGIPILDLDIKTAKHIVRKFKKHNRTIELIKDKTGYYFGQHKLTVEFLCRIGFSDKVTTTVMREVLKIKDGKAEDCKKLEPQ